MMNSMENGNEDDHDPEETLEMMRDIMPRRNLKRKHEVFDEIVVWRAPPGFI
jgi:hypothetical protein